MLADFHFLRPEWLLGLLPLAALLWTLRGPAGGSDAWSRVCDAHLLRHLRVRGGEKPSRLPLITVGAAWLTAVLALANPTWDRRELPVLESLESRVLVLDLSRSMLAGDVKPTRLARARFEVEEILDQVEEGQTGLVVYAGDAFVASPLTSDTNTIRSLLAALDPSIMPARGNRPDLGLLEAGRLLRQAGAARGEILLIAAGAHGEAAMAAARGLAGEGYRTSVLGVTADASTADLGTEVLRAVATAGGGRFAPIAADNRDVSALLSIANAALDVQTAGTGRASEVWLERGPWLTVLLLPLAALAFRRGWLLALPIVLIVGMSPQESAVASTWDDLWARQDQQAARALAAGDLERARELAVDAATRGTAAYRAGDYQAASEAFEVSRGADSEYNLGNALARSGKLQEAISAYERALQASPEMEDAAFNKALLEELLEQQQLEQRQDQQEGNAESGQEQSGGQQQDSASGNEPQNQNADGQENAASGQDPQGDQPQSGTAQEAGDSAPSADRQPGPDSTADAQRESAEQGEGDDSKGGAEDSADQADHDRRPGERANVEEAGSFADAAETDARQGDNAADTGGAKPGEDHEMLEGLRQVGPGSEDGDPAERNSAGVIADDLNSEELQAAEQWLRRIPDDPGALLRRKFLYQYKQRAAASTFDASRTW